MNTTMAQTKRESNRDAETQYIHECDKQELIAFNYDDALYLLAFTGITQLCLGQLCPRGLFGLHTDMDSLEMFCTLDGCMGPCDMVLKMPL